MTTEPNDSTIPSLDVGAAGRQLADMVVANPLPSVLAAAATGAGLMALIALMARSNSKLPSLSELAALAADKLPTPPDVPSTDSLKDQLTELLDRITGALPSKKDAKGQAQDAVDAAQSTWEGVRDTVRDQAASVIDQVQPQLTAATKVARDNPVWAAVVAGVIGTLIGAQFLGKSSGK